MTCRTEPCAHSVIHLLLLFLFFISPPALWESIQSYQLVICIILKIKLHLELFRNVVMSGLIIGARLLSNIKLLEPLTKGHIFKRRIFSWTIHFLLSNRKCLQSMNQHLKIWVCRSKLTDKERKKPPSNTPLATIQRSGWFLCASSLRTRPRHRNVLHFLTVTELF